MGPFAPAPAAQARDDSRTRSNWRTWPHRKLRRKVRVGRLTAWRQLSRPYATRRPSMKSPPASAEATRVSILSPGFARPGRARRLHAKGHG